MSSSPTFLDPIVIPRLVGESVLDVGCGYGRWGALIHSNYWEAGRQTPPIVDGIDAFLPNVEFCASLPFYRSVRQHVLPQALEGSWDTVLACEIIEHIEQECVSELLSMFERIARRRVIITTPNWPDRRGGANTKLGWNDYEAHVSHVSRAEFRRRGYKLCGAGFGNPNHFVDRSFQWMRRMRRGEEATEPVSAVADATPSEIVVRTQMRELRRAFGGVSLLFPSFGHTVVAYKDIGSRNAQSD